jgi:hypothetical protein
MDEKRNRLKPIPDDVRKYLNDAQQAQLNTIEGFGWNLKYIRRPLFQESVVVVSDPNGTLLGILEEDGRLNMESDMGMRK